MANPIKNTLLRKPVLSWALYDWANSAFATTVMAGFFPVFYGAIGKGMSPEASQFRLTLSISIASAVVAVMAPILGAIADRGGNRKKFLTTFAALGIVMTAALYVVQQGQWLFGLLLYALGTVGFSGANVFYDSMLVDVAEEEEFDLVSAYGFSVGYLGGGLLFTLNVLMTLFPDAFGLPDQGTAVRVSFVSVAVWWAVFSLPVLLFVKETPAPDRASKLQMVREGLGQLLQTLRQIRHLKILLIFLAGYWLYIDAVNTVIKMAVFFGDTVLSLPPQSLIVALLLTQFVAFPAALGFGWLGKRIGPKPAILLGLAVYILTVVYAWRWLVDVNGFYMLAVVVGLVQGGVQSLSRSLYARLIPQSKSAEFFGFFNMVGKFAAVLGPLLMGVVPILTGNARDGILAVSVLFVVGGFLLSRVSVEKGIQAAVAMDGK
jgi:UMF1 family MFS transporter